MVHHKFNREVLALMRETRAYTQVELSKLLGVEQGTISKIETGACDVSDEVLQKLPGILECPLDIFFTDVKVIRVEGHYRKKISLPKKKLKKNIGLMTFSEMHINKLSDAVELPHPNIPSWDVELDGGPKEAAKFVREYWNIPRGRILDLAKFLEDNGIVICPLNLDDLDALSTFSSECNIPILYVNKNRSADRIRFNIAHELGHYVMHFGKKVSADLDIRDIEKEANLFASELLLPSEDIVHQLYSLSIEKLADLKKYWRVSMAAILMKAKGLSVITENQYKYLWRQMSYLGYRTKEPVELTPDSFSILSEIFSTYLSDLQFSKSDLANLLNMTQEELEVSYFGAKPRVRLKVSRP